MEIDELKELWPLDFWQSQEWKDVQRRLKGLKRYWNPGPDNLMAALEMVALRNCRVAVVGQDPYPDIRENKPPYATGIAFSIDPECTTFPGSLKTLFTGYVADLQYGWPTTGYLGRWCEQGVLLWNATPTIEVERDGGSWKTYSHRDWSEWHSLTQEIVERLSAKGNVVFAFLGARAREYAQFVDDNAGYNTCLFYTHPSPRAQINAKDPFITNRFFTTINDKLLNKHSQDTVDWRLDST